MDINPLDMLKNIQNLQGQMGDVQEKLKNIEVEGNSGGGLVKVKFNGEMQMTSIAIDPVAVDPRDVKMLEELIISACHSAQTKVKGKLQEEMAGAAGFPGGFPKF